jgi:3-oxoacyl-[acyl-carrier protein] reductase
MIVSSLNKRIVLITGAGRGIGKSVFIKFIEAGATVIGFDYNEQLVSEMNSYLRNINKKGCGLLMDITNQEDIDKSLNFVKQEYGSPEILVNNAGVTKDNLVIRMTDEEWIKVIDTNLTSIFRLSRACLRGMLKSRFGRIINVTSIVGHIGNAGQANYAASKSGLVAFSKTLAHEVASRGITVNCISPGFIETNMTNKLSVEQREKLCSKIPMQRIGIPDEIANIVIFLASNEASYITGSVIHANGGMFMQ